VRAAPYEEYVAAAAAAPGAGTGGGGASAGAAAVPSLPLPHPGDATALQPSARHKPPSSGQQGQGKLNVTEFFGLLRSHVPAAHLQVLLSSLAQFNQKLLGSEELMRTAAEVLRPAPSELAAAGMAPAPVDLLAAFEAYMRK
jgi:hypothetical protein